MKQTPLRPKSDKKIADDEQWEYDRQQAIYRDRGECQFMRALRRSTLVLEQVPESRGAGHVHHILPRGRGGTHELSNLVCLCTGHHQWVHNHPTFSKRLGLLR